MHGKDWNTLIEQPRTVLNQPILQEKILKDRDTLIEQSPQYEIL